MREQRRDLDSALPVLLELPRRGQQRRVAIGELAGNFAETLRKLLPLVFLQRRFRIESIDMAGCAYHEEEDHRLGFRREVLRLGRERILARGGEVLSLQ